MLGLRNGKQTENGARRGSGNRFKAAMAEARRFFADELWDRDVAALPRVKRAAFSLCRIVSIVIRGFVDDRCGLQASALTFITLMSLVPVLAMMFSVAKGLGFQTVLMEKVGLEKVETREVTEGKEVIRIHFRVPEPRDGQTEPSGVASLTEPAQKVIFQIFQSVENTNLGSLGIVGLLMLFWAAIKSISKVENTFNSIWGVQVSRPLLRKFSDYISVLFVIPVFFLAATSANAAVSSPAVIARMQSLFGPLALLYQQMIRLSGLLIITVALAFAYAFIPNTKVRLFPALAAGLVGGILWDRTQWLYLTCQVGLAKNNAIYGTFAAIPFFLAWLYANWTIILFGAEVSFAVQNHRTYRLEGISSQASHSVREMLGMIFTFEACRSLSEGKGSWNAGEFAETFTVPSRLMSDVSNTLVSRGILVPVADENDCFVPGRDMDVLSLADIEAAFRQADDPNISQFAKLADGGLREAYMRGYRDFDNQLSKTTFRELLRAREAAGA